MNVVFTVRPDLEFWACDYGKYESGAPHEVKAGKGFVAQIASAARAGSLIDVVYDKAASKHAAAAVEPDEKSLKALEKAQASGEWQVGNLLQHELDQRSEDGD
jgi:hypothetical protein